MSSLSHLRVLPGRADRMLRTAATGATLREMMDRMGHGSPRAVLIYMHRNDARQRKIADSLNKRAIKAEPQRPTPQEQPPAEVIGHASVQMLDDCANRPRGYRV
jgi:hypothetical protein